MMRRSTQQFAIVWALLLSATAGGQVIRLRAAAVVDAPVVRLADVARIAISQDGKMPAIGRVLVARAPRVGAKKRLTLHRIEDRLERLGYDLSAVLLTGSRVCVITRTAAAKAKAAVPAESAVDAIVSASASAIPLAQRRTLEQAIRRHLIGRAKHGGEALRIDFRSTDRMLLQLTESVGRFAISTRHGRTLGTVPLTINVPVAEGKAQQLKIIAEVYLLRQRVVARRALAKGRVLTAADVQVVSQRVTRPDDRIATALNGGVVGTVLSSPLAAGEAVRLDRLKRPALIRRGDAVTVVYLRGRLSVKTIAWATRDAALGEQVRLRSARRSKETFSAVCTGPRSARIDFGHPGSLRSVGAGSEPKGNRG